MEMEKCVIYGAGWAGRHANLRWLSSICKVVAYCDADPKKTGTLIRGYSIINRNELQDFCEKHDVTLILVALLDEMLCCKVVKELRMELGYPKIIEIQGFSAYFQANRDRLCLFSTPEMAKTEQTYQVDKGYISDILDINLEDIRNCYCLKRKKTLQEITDVELSAFGYQKDDFCKIYPMANYVNEMYSEVGLEESEFESIISNTSRSKDNMVCTFLMKTDLYPIETIKYLLNNIGKRGKLVLIEEETEISEYTYGAKWKLVINGDKTIISNYKSFYSLEEELGNNVKIRHFERENEEEKRIYCIEISQINLKKYAINPAYLDYINIVFSKREAVGFIKKDANIKKQIREIYELEQLYCAVGDICKRNEITQHVDVVFVVGMFSVFAEGTSKLIYMYGKRKKCLVVFPKYQRKTWCHYGIRNMKRQMELMNQLVANGIGVTTGDDIRMTSLTCDLCFNLDYSTGKDTFMSSKKHSKRYVVIQSVAFYTHCFMKNYEDNSFEMHFSDCVRDGMDYYIGSQYTCDWFTKNDSSIKHKVLALGYPKLDTLYEKKNTLAERPAWMPMIDAGRTRVFLSANYSIDELLPFFKKEHTERFLIWRPHPLTLGQLDNLNLDAYNVAVDTSSDYSYAFNVSDAFISDIAVSLTANYLYWNKPILLYNNEVEVKGRWYEPANYEAEPWYLASYHGFTPEDIRNFVEMVERGEDTDYQKHKEYYDYMAKHFDGKVCERIVDYFENEV